MSDFSFETSSGNFATEVLDASHAVPVVVDFWAPWCAPCRALKPILEKLAAEYKGQFLLAKINTDEHPEVSARYGVRGIPNVKAFIDGRMVGEFTGALPESAVRQFIEQLLPGPSERARRVARGHIAQGDFDAAEASLREALRLDERNDKARIELAELLVARHAYEDAETLLKDLLPVHRDARVEQMEARIDVWKKSRSLPDLSELQGRVRDNPDDLTAQLEYAERLLVDAHYEQALDALLEVVRRDRGDLREKARQAMLQVFNLAAENRELVGDYRRKLAAALN